MPSTEAVTRGLTAFGDNALDMGLNLEVRDDVPKQREIFG